MSLKDYEIRFWSRVKITPDGCWEWTGTLDHNGHGRFVLRNKGRVKTYAAHRAAAAFFGMDCRGRCVCHTCDNRKCVRPSHFFLGSHADNMHDMMLKHRRRKGMFSRRDRQRAA